MAKHMAPPEPRKPAPVTGFVRRVLIGVITVDDVLELTLPSGWRRRFGVVRD